MIVFSTLVDHNKSRSKWGDMTSGRRIRLFIRTLPGPLIGSQLARERVSEGEEEHCATLHSHA